MEVPHANLSEVSEMVLVKIDSAVVLATRVATTSRVLSVLADTAVTVRHVTFEHPGLLAVGTHVCVQKPQAIS